MQWAEGGRSVLSSPPFIFQFLIQHFTSLDDFIDARLGRRPANIHLHPYSAPNSARVSSTASTTASVPPDSPSLASQSLMSDESAPITPTQETNKHGPHLTASASDAPQSFSAQDPLSRSARIRAFRAFQHASPEEKERMRGDWGSGLGAAGTDNVNRDNSAGGAGMRGEWTAVHLLSADEVKSLFKDVVEGLRFLVFLFLFVFVLQSNFCGFYCSIVNRYCILILNLGMCS